MSILDKAKTHYKSQMSADLRGPIRVEEWDAEIYYRPTMSMAQQSSILELHQQKKIGEATIMLLIIRALDADGKPLFNKADKAELMRSVDSDVVARVVSEITDGDDEAEAIMGN
jgi:hypothetical protein